MEMLTLSESVHQAMRAHAEEIFPCECCGALLGTHEDGGWRVTVALRAKNVRGSQSRTTYEIAPEELVDIDREARQRGLEIAGFYHSHPDHEAHWSASDLAGAHWIGCCYLILSVRQGRLAESRAFLLAGRQEEDKHFVEVTLQLMP